MPLYNFERLHDNQPVELFFGMSTVPCIGDIIEVDGLQYRRTFSECGVNERDNHYPYESVSLNRYHPDCPVGTNGKPIIKSKQHEDFICKKYGALREF